MNVDMARYSWRLLGEFLFVVMAAFWLAHGTPAFASEQCDTNYNGCYYDDPNMNYQFQCGVTLASAIGGCCGSGSGWASCEGGSMYSGCDESGRECECDIYGDYCQDDGPPEE